MSKPAAIFVAAAMAVTAGCVGLIAGRGFDLSLAQSALAAIGALLFMALIHLAFLRASPKDDGRVDDIDRVVTELQSRLETAEARLAMLDGAGAERARAATRPLVEEIAALGGLVTSIAKEVAGHDRAIARLKSAAEPAAAPAPPAVPAPVAPSPAAVEPPPPPAAPRAEPRGFAPPRPAAPALQPAPEPFDLDEPGAESPAPDLRRRFERALVENRIEPYLQPIVTLPGRRATHYEALARLVERDGVMAAADFLAGAGPRIAEVDLLTLERAAGVAARLEARGGGSVFVNVSPETLGASRAAGELSGLLARHKDVARLIVIELRQAAFASLGAEARTALDGLVDLGARVSLDEAIDLRLDARELVRHGVRFVKVPAARLLDPEAARGAAIHPADLAGLLARHGVDLIATHVEEERTVPELLDMEVRFAQGFLFAAPRPVRPAAEAPQPERAAPSRLVPRAAAR